MLVYEDVVSVLAAVGVELAVCAVVASASSAASTATSPLTALLAAGTLWHLQQPDSNNSSSTHTQLRFVK
jgi:hypothetical protein